MGKDFSREERHISPEMTVLDVLSCHIQADVIFACRIDSGLPRCAQDISRPHNYQLVVYHTKCPNGR